MEYVKGSVKTCSFCAAVCMVFLAVLVVLNFVVLGLNDRSFVTSMESIYVFSPLLQGKYLDGDDKAAMVIQWLFLVAFTFCMLVCTVGSSCFGCLVFAFRDDKNKIFSTVLGVCFCFPIVPCVMVYCVYLFESFIYSIIRIFTTEELDEEILLGMLLFHTAPFCICFCCCFIFWSSIVNIVWDVLEFLGVVQVGVVKAKFDVISHNVEVESHLEHSADASTVEAFMDEDLMD